MKVDKDQFDNLLHKMTQTQPEPKSAIKTIGEAGKTIPATPEPSTPRKA
jgi:hypothetical protein